MHFLLGAHDHFVTPPVISRPHTPPTIARPLLPPSQRSGSSDDAIRHGARIGEGEHPTPSMAVLATPHETLIREADSLFAAATSLA